MPRTYRAAFLVDGFNVYHSIKYALATTSHGSLKWLDLHGLCQVLCLRLGKNVEMERVVYFSAPARHLGRPDVVERHMVYSECLKNSGVKVVMSKFKKKKTHCPECNARFVKHEEKETDVAMATKLFELLITDACDAAVLVTGDTDLLPAIRTARSLFPKKRIWVGFPHREHTSKELRRAAFSHFRITADQYATRQFPRVVRLRDGRVLTKPASW